MNAQEEKLLFEKKRKVAYIIINNLRKKNAIEIPMIYTFLDFLEKVDNDPHIKCLIIKSTGDDIFSAGWDLAMFEPGKMENIDILFNDGARISKKIHMMKKPVIVEMQGSAVGTGTIIALAADFRFVANKKDIFFQLPELNIGPGIFPATGPTVGAVKILGNTRAKDMLFTGRRVSLEEFDSWGAISRIIDPPENLSAAVDEFARNLTKKSAELLILTKNAINRMSMDIERFYNLENDMGRYYFDGLQGKERENIDIFLERINKKYSSSYREK
ncbi:MAG: enoyl-CoA hydratase/isomerase family protein [Promethearchaeota archaeon]|nr:MAG: enoyl-CoA hydratase/isomerase family protein [Candidatus Lokiarchaeota archaeon]